ELEAFLRRQLSAYDGPNRSLRTLATNLDVILGGKAPGRAADVVVGGDGNARTFLEAGQLDSAPLSAFAHAVVCAVLRRRAQQLAGAKSAGEVAKLCEDRIGAERPLLATDDFPGIVRALVASGREDRRGYVRDGVKTLLLRDA